MNRDLLKRMSKQWESKFSHRYACWANNHNGWAKMKKTNLRLAKRKAKRLYQKEIEIQLEHQHLC